MQLGRESWRSYTRRPRRAFGKRHRREPNPACISEAALHGLGFAGWRERRKSFYTSGCCLPACLPACMMLHWKVWKGWHFSLKVGLWGDKADIMVMSIPSERRREEHRDVRNPRSSSRLTNTSGLSQSKKQSPYTGWCCPMKQPIFLFHRLYFSLKHDLTLSFCLTILVFRDI